MTRKRLPKKKEREPLFHQLPILTKEECDRVRDGVSDLRSHWTPVFRRGPLNGAPCFRLGSSLEHPEKEVGYADRAKRNNLLLRGHFGWLYDKVLGCLTDHFEQPVIYRKNAGLPGFRIVMSDAVFCEHGAPWHTDFDSLLLDWEYPVTFDQLQTMTLPVSLPTSGGTLDVKDLLYEDMQMYPRDEIFRKKVAEADILARIPHKLGQILLQHGQRFHRIGMLHPPVIEGEMRITMQAHIVPQKDHWEVHW